MRVVNYEQGTPDWLLWRNVGLGGSDAPVLWWGKHFETTVEKLWMEKALAVHGDRIRRLLPGVPWVSRPKRENTAMKMGKDAEPLIRKWYQDWTGFTFEPLCAVHDTVDWLKGSLDGWIGEKKVVVEIKRPGMRRDGSCDHHDALEGRVPPKYVPQLLHLCLVTGAERAHYLSYGDPKHFPPLDRYRVVEYVPSRSERGTLLGGEEKFWACVQGMEIPDRATLSGLGNEAAEV